jgi:type I restriction enzyme R subunit
MPEVASRRPFHAAINFIYKSLQEDRERADISEIIKELHGVVADAIRPMPGLHEEDGKIYDISSIDFERLRQEFERSPRKNTQIRALRDVIEQRLAAMIARNPLRMNFQRRYEELVIEYNAEKDRVTIENSFEQLWGLVRALDEEAERALREGLDGEETLALFDLLKKPELTPNEIKRIKAVATELCAKLKAAEKEIDKWRRKERTRDRVRQMIHDTLFLGETGLPGSYTDDEISLKAEAIFGFVYSQPEPHTEPA